MSDILRARHCLRGLSIGDAFGECFFREPFANIVSRTLPTGVWRWTDDTHMALSIVRVLRDHGRIDPDALAAGFAGEFQREPWRGYAGGARRLLTALGQGASWQVEAPALFDGGSFGNGGAMRAAPIGAYFAGDPARAAREADQSAQVTHAHPEGRAGAMAVAAAAALYAAESTPVGNELLTAVLRVVPNGMTSDATRLAMDIPPDAAELAAARLGTGDRVSAMDTAPYCLWMVAHHGADFEEAMWRTVAGLGDRDTTCAIVGGILAADGRSLPADWHAHAEDLPDDLR